MLNYVATPTDIYGQLAKVFNEAISYLPGECMAMAGETYMCCNLLPVHYSDLLPTARGEGPNRKYV